MASTTSTLKAMGLFFKVMSIIGAGIFGYGVVVMLIQLGVPVSDFFAGFVWALVSFGFWKLAKSLFGK